MKKRILVGGIGILLVIATVVTLGVVRAASVSSDTNSSLLANSKHSPCPSTDQGICQSHVLVQTQVPLTTTLPSPTPTQVTPPTPTPTPMPTPMPTVNSGTGNVNGGTNMEKQLAQQLFDQINIDRAAQGLPSYAWSNTLAGGAYRHNVVMTTTGCGLLHQ